MPVRREVTLWVGEARSDLRHAKASLELGDYNWACFAAQQAAEKALKALAMHVLGEHPRGHDLLRIYRALKGQGVELRVGEAGLSRLSAYYTIARYPNAGIERPSEEITAEQAREAIGVAEAVLGEVEEALRDP